MDIYGIPMSCASTPGEVYASTATMTGSSLPQIDDILDELTLTVVFDNTCHKPSCEASWGFACVVTLHGRTILFDTGADGDILLSNMRAMNIAPADIDLVVLSHEHWDHIGGLPAFLAANHDVTVIMPQSFSQEIKDTVIDTGAILATTDGPAPITGNVFTTGEMGTTIIEQALVIETGEGMVIVTGCAHPGIMPILQTVTERYDTPIRFVLGGFHLKDTPEADIRAIIDSFRDLGVMYAGATHCTGNEAIRLFAEAYEDRFVHAGAGRIITLDNVS